MGHPLPVATLPLAYVPWKGRGLSPPDPDALCRGVSRATARSGAPVGDGLVPSRSGSTMPCVSRPTARVALAGSMYISSWPPLLAALLAAQATVAQRPARRPQTDKWKAGPRHPNFARVTTFPDVQEGWWSVAQCDVGAFSCVSMQEAVELGTLRPPTRMSITMRERSPRAQMPKAAEIDTSSPRPAGDASVRATARQCTWGFR